MNCSTKSIGLILSFGKVNYQYDRMANESVIAGGSPEKQLAIHLDLSNIICWILLQVKTLLECERHPYLPL